MKIFDGVDSQSTFLFTPTNRLGEPILTGKGGEPFQIELWHPMSPRMIEFQADAADDTEILSLKMRQRLRSEDLEEGELRERFIDGLLDHAVETRTDEVKCAIKGWFNFPRCLDPVTGKPLPDDEQPDTTCNEKAIEAFVADNPIIVRQMKTAYQQEKNSLLASRRASRGKSSDMSKDNADSTSQSQTDKEANSLGENTSDQPIH